MDSELQRLKMYVHHVRNLLSINYSGDTCVFASLTAPLKLRSAVVAAIDESPLISILPI